MKMDGKMRALEKQLERLAVGNRQAAELEFFGIYRDRLVDFLHEVRRGDLTEHQVEIAEALTEHRFVAVRSCNGGGKDWLAAGIALWWAVARRGLVILSGPTARQVKKVCMQTELAAAFYSAGNIPGELLDMELRIPGAPGIIAMTSTDVSKVSGFHASSVLVILTEAQGVEPYAWEGFLSCLTGEDSACLVLGNPLAPVGRFFEVCRSPRWKTIAISALDHPNVVQGREVIPGAVTQRFVDMIRDEYGEDSGVYKARVLGEFPDDAEESLVRREWLDAAADRWEELAVREAGDTFRLALDVARMGADSSVLAVASGGLLVGFRIWRKRDTMESVRRVERAIEDFLAMDEDGECSRTLKELTIDEIGIGAGVVDRLREKGHHVTAFNAARSASDDGRDRFQNLRAESFWHLRTLLERGAIALPRDEALFEELLATTWAPNGQGRTVIAPKELIKSTLGRSPDRADAVAMVFANYGGARGRRFGLFYPGMEDSAA